MLTCKSDNQHDWHLSPFGLVKDGNADNEQGDEDECQVGWDLVLASGRRNGVFVYETVYRSADGDTETEEETVYDGVDDSDRSGNDGAGLELEGGTHWSISGCPQFPATARRYDSSRAGFCWRWHARVWHQVA